MSLFYPSCSIFWIKIVTISFLTFAFFSCASFFWDILLSTLLLLPLPKSSIWVLSNDILCLISQTSAKCLSVILQCVLLVHFIFEYIFIAFSIMSCFSFTIWSFQCKHSKALYNFIYKQAFLLQAEDWIWICRFIYYLYKFWFAPFIHNRQSPIIPLCQGSKVLNSFPC